MAEYSREVLKVVVAQICQSVGWRSVHSSSLKVIVDLLDEYLRQLARISHEYVEVLGRTDMNLDDVGLAFQNMNIDLNKLAEYVENAGSMPCVIKVPQYPIPREDQVILMEPGSHGVLKRPIYVPEYLPPIYPELKKFSSKTEVELENDTGYAVENEMNAVINNQELEGFTSCKRIKYCSETESLRKIQSVMMTTSGFLSPVREGKLPEPSTLVQSYAEFFEEPEICIIDEMTMNTDCQDILHQNPAYLYSQDELMPPRTPEVPKTPEIKISKVESLANVPEEREKWSESSVTTTPPVFPIFPVMSNGPGLIPYSIHPIPSLLPPTQLSFQKNQVSNASKYPKISKEQSSVQNYALSGSIINCVSKKLDDMKKSENNKGQRNKSKKERHSDIKEKREDKKKKKEDDDVTIVYPVDTSAHEFSTTKLVKKSVIDKNKDSTVKNKPRLKALSNSSCTPITTPGSSTVPVDKKKKRNADNVAKINSKKSLVPGKKISFNIPKKVEPVPVVEKKKPKYVEVKKTVKKEKQPKEEVITPFIYDSKGQKIWICPVCGLVDNGSPMIGCDDCDAWYHWICIGMRVPPPREVNWYCRVCIAKKHKKNAARDKTKL